MSARISRRQAEAAGILLPKAQPQYRAGVMNKIESAYATTLESAKLAGLIASYSFESIKLKLARATYYTPDFLVVYPNGDMEFHETKGFWRDDARVKIKVAARLFPMFKFVAVRKVKCEWVSEEILA